MLLADNLDQLLDILPDFIIEPLKKNERKSQLIEIVLDVGRRPEARFADKSEYISYRTVVWNDLNHILKRLGKFSGDNRAGIEKTLHRISALRNREGVIIGLTCRIGRAVFGTVTIICDLLERQQSILLLGRPGVGKTTTIREIARVLSDEMKKRVIIIDTSNEIAGDGDLPHPSIGKARRMQVTNPQHQHQIMIEAVENHMPEIIIIDEIGTELEASAARTIAERGVQLVGTAHGRTIENLIKNPTLTDLVGGIQYVTLGDEEARRRGSSKSILERKAQPTFDVGIEIHDAKTWIIHENIGQSVDSILQSNNLPLQKRLLSGPYNTGIKCEILQFNQKSPFPNRSTISSQDFIENKKKKFIRESKTVNNSNYFETESLKQKKTNKSKILAKKKVDNQFIFLYVYGINSQDIRSLIKTLNLSIIITREIHYADAVLALGNLLKNNKKLKQLSNLQNLNLFTVQNGSLLQISHTLRQIVNRNQINTPLKKEERIRRVSNKLLSPLEEVRLVIEEVVIPQKRPVNLLPRTHTIRKLQHEIINHYHLKSLSVNNNKANSFIRIFPN